MKKLHAFLLCSIIGCATSTVWGAEQNGPKLLTQNIGSRQRLSKRCEGTVDEDLLMSSSVDPWLLAAIELDKIALMKERNGILREQLEATREQTAMIKVQNALQQQLADCLASIGNSH